MTRREWLAYMASLAVAPLWLPLGAHAAVGAAKAGDGSRSPRLIVVFLRGALDGLSVVAPWQEEAYYAARPALALPPAGETGGLLDLDGYFGMTPALKALYPHWVAGRLCFIHACGLTNQTRSHFEAQELIEKGLAGAAASARDGWLNRVLGELPAAGTNDRAVAVGSVVPLILRGNSAVASLSAGVRASGKAPQSDLLAEVAPLYDPADAVGKTFHNARQSREQLRAALEQEALMASNGAPSTDSFGRDAERLAAVMRQSPDLRIGMMSAGGWDTHVSQGGVDGALAVRLKHVADGLSRLAEGLGPVFDQTVIVVVSEFGRTVQENGTGGTDHGHGNALWVLGGGVKGGRMRGDWPGLRPTQLHEGRDLRVVTDYRQVLGEILTGHMGLDRQQLARVFPGFRPSAPLGLV